MRHCLLTGSQLARINKLVGFMLYCVARAFWLCTARVAGKGMKNQKTVRYIARILVTYKQHAGSVVGSVVGFAVLVSAAILGWQQWQKKQGFAGEIMWSM